MNATKLKDGGPAFPSTGWDETGRYPGHFLGMTVRDYFAAKAMGSFMSKSLPAGWDEEMIADKAYVVADAMLAARGAGGFGSTGA